MRIIRDTAGGISDHSKADSRAGRNQDEQKPMKAETCQEQPETPPKQWDAIRISYSDTIALALRGHPRNHRINYCREDPADNHREAEGTEAGAMYAKQRQGSRERRESRDRKKS